MNLFFDRSNALESIAMYFGAINIQKDDKNGEFHRTQTLLQNVKRKSTCVCEIQTTLIFLIYKR
jgi:hypothetical protein